MHGDMQVSSKKTVSGAFYSWGSRLVKFPWQSSFGIPQKRGPIMHPDPLFIIQFFCDSEKFCQFPEKFSPNYQKILPES